MEGLIPFLTALGLVFVLELGDKTQLATISLATRHPWPPVLAGAATALVLITAIGAAIGGAIAVYLEAWLVAIKIGGGLLFIVFGAWTYLSYEEESEEATDARGAFVTAFGLNFVAELGDKTQLAVIILAATAAAPFSTFAGASLALVLVSALSVLIGVGLERYLRGDWLRLVATGLFIVAGILLIAEALWNL